MSAMAKRRAVLFDLDDTLLDRATSLDRYLVGHHTRLGLEAIPFEAYRERFQALDGDGYIGRVAIFTALLTEFPISIPLEVLDQDFKQHAWRTATLYPDARDVLRTLRDLNLRIGIITNGPSPVQRPKLDSTGVLELVDVALVSGEEDCAKPDPVIFHRAAERLGVNPEECVFVGDHPRIDIEGALGAGMDAIWVERRIPWPNESSCPRPRSITALGELLPLLPAG
jgi:putative hydrolase of the HAD superfamily